MARGLILWGRFVVGEGANRQRITVPAPNTDPGKPYLARFVHENAAAIAGSFDYAQWPPLSKVQGGNGAGCDGYEVFDLWDLGTKNQQGSVATRYGILEDKMAAVSALNSYGCESIGDLSLHQRGGENGGPGVFRFLGSSGKKQNGRGACNPGDFRGNTSWDAIGKKFWDPIPPFGPVDNVPVPFYDFPFGRETRYENGWDGSPRLQDAKAHIAWLKRRLGIPRFRFDDTKGTNPLAVRKMMDAVPDVDFYSEYDDGDPNALDWWATSAPMHGRSGVEDFPFHYTLQNACNNYDATHFGQFGSGFWQSRPDLSVTFCDNPDTDTSDGQQVKFNKGLAYAVMLNVPSRLALVYGKDYFPSTVWPGAYGLQPIIDNLCWISGMFAYGAFQQVWVDRDVFAFTRDGNGGPVGWSGGLLVAINFNTYEERMIEVQTPFGPNRWLHDYRGNIGDTSTDSRGKVRIKLPANAWSNGLSSVALAPGGVTKPVWRDCYPTEQTFVGDDTMDVDPVWNGKQILPQRLYVREGSEISLDFQMQVVKDIPPGMVNLELLDPDLHFVSGTSSKITGAAKMTAKAVKTGWHTIQTTGFMLPPEGSPFELTARYTGA